MMLSGLGMATRTTQFVTGALEASNVDPGDQFSKMNITQRAYSSAAKVITTADEISQAMRDLRRQSLTA
jgi:flagellar hook protein FlgE